MSAKRIYQNRSRFRGNGYFRGCGNPRRIEGHQSMAGNRGRSLDWQLGKSVVDCNRYMLEHGIATDVCFEVGPPGGRVGLVQAHRYILVSRSSVFEAMFCGGMAESRASSDVKIPITDVEVPVFREMLRFMYCESANVSPDTALPLLYAAKKYLLLDLVDQCQKFLQDNLTTDTVCSILDLGLTFDEPDLTARCLDYISEKALEVFETDGFLHMSPTALDAVMRLDVISATETLMYESCMKWARSRAPVKPVTDAQIREILGAVVYRIRFPTMDATEFTRLVIRTEVLSLDEKLSVYFYYHTRGNGNVTDDNSAVSTCLGTYKPPFDIAPRKPHETVISRFSGTSASEWPTAGKADAIDFMSDADVVLIAVGLYGSSPGSMHDVTIEVWMGKILLCIVSKKFETPTTAEPAKIYIGQRVKIQANIMHTVVTTIKGPCTRYGIGGRPRIISSGIVFMLSPSSKCGGRTGVESGQIPQLFFHTCLTDKALGYTKPDKYEN